MFEALLRWSIRYRGVVLLLTLALLAAGSAAAVVLPFDAFPDLTNTQVQVLTSCPSLGTLDAERWVSAPVERALSGLPNVVELRSISRPGVSAVTIVFREGTDPWWARARVAERMPTIRAEVPARYGSPELGPTSTGLGEIYQFEVRGPGHSLMELRDLLEWQVAPRLRLVPGVTEVNAHGGEARAWQVTVQPDRLRAAGVSLSQVFEALEANNRSAGGGEVRRGPEGVLVRGEGLLTSLEELRAVPLLHRGGVALTLGQVAEVEFAPLLRHGVVTRDGRGEAVTGTVFMVMGENTRVVARAVDQAVRELARTLPQGVTLEPYYDRTTLVDRTLRTVGKNLLEGCLLVVGVLLLLLRNARAGFVAAAVIPLAMLGAVLGMSALGVSGNLMSLGALDFGLLVDGAIVLLENALHRLDEARAHKGSALSAQERDEVVLTAALEVRGATAFGEAIIALVYLPVLTLQGVEGRLFRPMAITVLCALGTAFVLSLTFVPALASLVLSRAASDKPSPVVTFARWLYEPLLKRVLARPLPVLLLAATLAVGGGALARRLGSEFVPVLEEGAVAVETVRLPSTSLAESARGTTLMERIARRHPEVLTAVSKTGRPEVANDPMGHEQSDVYLILREGTNRLALVEQLEREYREEVPGAATGFLQPIQMRTNELVSGVRADFAVKLYGDDLAVLERLGERVVRSLNRTRGAVDVRADRVDGLPVLRLVPERPALARRGLNVDEVLQAIEAIGGASAGSVMEGRRRYPLQVRLAPEAREDVEALGRIPLRGAEGRLVDLGEVTTIDRREEPALLNREALSRRLIIQANVRGRDLGGFAEEAIARIERELRPPPGYHAEYGGQFENLASARARLLVVVPVALGLILLLLRASAGSLGPALLIFLNVPFAAVGGVLALLARGMPFSISAGVGFVALSGVAVLNGLVLVGQVRGLAQEGVDATRAALEGSLRRLRPVLTTALVASLGFLPMAFGSGTGAEVQRPLATVVVGGLVSSTLSTLLVLPALYALASKRR